jgi:nucleotide-binding universal stress UspA family protein
MNPIRRILVALDQAPNHLAVLQKSCVLARYFGAEVELFSCESSAEQLAHCRRLLAALRASITADDLVVRSSTSLSSPPHTGILRRAGDYRADLIIRAAPSRLTLDYFDRELVRLCALPLLFTRGETWQPSPRVAVLLFGAPDGVLEFASYIARSCHGEMHELDARAAARGTARIDLVVAGEAAAPSSALDVAARLPADLLLVRPAGSA